MDFVTTPGIGRMVFNELRSAVEVRLATAYFSPDEELLSLLRDVPKLTLIVSEEFTINDPYKLEKLSLTANVRSVPSDGENGKLHAKVFIVKRRDTSLWALVGSANLTWQGMFSNQEACITLDTRNPPDKKPLEGIRNWFDSLLESARRLDLQEAKRVFDTRSEYRLEQRDRRSAQTSHDGPRYWALKCTSGSSGENYWQKFLADSVIAIGWSKIDSDPSHMSHSQLIKMIEKSHPEDNPKRAANTIKKFIGLKVGDIVMICRGFPPNQRKPVNIYGFARVTGPFRYEPQCSWKWKLKHDAIIQPIEMFVPKETVAVALIKGSLRGTMNALDQQGFERLVEQLGINLQV